MPFDGITALFHPTPQEYLNGMWKIVKKLPPSPPPGYVLRVAVLGSPCPALCARLTRLLFVLY